MSVGPALRPIPAAAMGQLVELHRAAFPAGQVACTIFAGKGVDRYLANLVAYPALQPDHELWGAWDGDRLLGYAHCRALAGSWHLNQIAVLPAAQGHGVGRLLWGRFVQSGRERSCPLLSLDVETGNTLAIEWYRRQGLQKDGTTWRWELPLRQDRTSPPNGQISLSGWEQAQAWQEMYGFSQFSLSCGEQTWTVGRLGDRYFRIDRPLPEAVSAALADLDPDRRLLLFTREPLADPSGQQLGSSLHMAGCLDVSGEER